MNLLDFINHNNDWEVKLSAAPYHVSIKWLDNYFICNYSLIESDLELKEVQEARGSIFVWDNEKGLAQYVCHPFNKFFNHGEALAVDIDWQSARVTEKVDGSLMKVWWHNGWHLSTNGVIDAFRAPVSDFGISFGQLFEKALGYKLEELGNQLDKDYTYCFELTAPESKLVIDYGYGVWYLASFNTLSGKECFDMPILKNVLYPKVYQLSSLKDTIIVVQSMNKDHEGVVVSDKYSNRIKVKSPEYLLQAHLYNNGAITKKRLVEYLRAGQLDDFIGAYPQYADFANNIKQAYANLIDEIEEEYAAAMANTPYTSKKDFALAIKDYKWKAYLFIVYDLPAGQFYNAAQWLLDMPLNKMVDLIGG